ncbi:hypothetical protein V2K50_11230 [Pseudomonas alliivorans]|nr:hypothetical protein [Pseudomonas alliivorans]
MSGIDKWLNRVALGSQILLVIIALITINYTVIPLYQKELSSEELAKAQIQLGNVQDKINDLTSSVASKELSLISTNKKLNEAESAEKLSRENLANLNKELSVQLKLLTDLKQQNKRIIDESAKLKGALVSENQLKFRQALEWFTLISDMGTNCYDPDMAEFFKDKEARKAETSKGCDPHAYVKSGIDNLRKFRRDASGDPLSLPDGTLDKWLNLAELSLQKDKFNMQSVYEISVYKSLDSENLVQKERESPKDFRARLAALDKARRDYASKSRSRDHDIAKKFIRSLDLSM